MPLRDEMAQSHGSNDYEGKGEFARIWSALLKNDEVQSTQPSGDVC